MYDTGVVVLDLADRKPYAGQGSRGMWSRPKDITHGLPFVMA